MSSETEFVIQDREKARLLSHVTCCRIEELFSVRIRLTRAHPSQAEWVSISGLSENTAKAKGYILALCTPEFGTEVKSSGKFTDLICGENSRLRNELEREYQTVILPSHTGNSIHVQGCEYSVCLTVSRLSSLMDTMDMMGLLPVQSSVRGPSVGQPSGSLDQKLQDVIQQMGSDSSNIQRLPEDVKQALLEGLEGERQYVARDPGAMLFDPHKEQRIEFFVRLDYPREKVEAVFDSLGRGASDNDILSRLVKVSSKPQSAEFRPKHLSNSRLRSPMGEPLSSTPIPVMNPAQLRPIVIDGSNIAMRHGNGKEFSCIGILLAVQWFLKRGHQEITVFVPSWRKEPSRPESPISAQEILYQLESNGYLVFTPSRRIGNKRIVCYDDRFIVRLASMNNGVIVSNDNYRDLINENPKWRETIEQRLLMFAFVNDIFMVPEDPLGRHGPSLDRLLHLAGRAVSAKGSPEKQAKECPYGDRCTFGKKCRYYHPERENRETVSPVPERRAPSGTKDDLRLNGGSTEDLYHKPERPDAAALDLSDRMHAMRISRPESIPLIVEPRTYNTRFIQPTSHDPEQYPPLMSSHHDLSSVQPLEGRSYPHRVTYPIANLHLPTSSARQRTDVAFHGHSMSHSKSHGNIPLPELLTRDSMDYPRQDPPGLTPRSVGDSLPPHRYSQPGLYHHHHHPYRVQDPHMPHTLPSQTAPHCVVDYRSLQQQRYYPNVGYAHEPMPYQRSLPYRPDNSPARVMPRSSHVYSQQFMWQQGGYDVVDRDGVAEGPSKLFKQAAAVLPGYEDRIRVVMLQYPHVTELERLVELVREMD